LGSHQILSNSLKIALGGFLGLAYARRHRDQPIKGSSLKTWVEQEGVGVAMRASSKLSVMGNTPGKKKDGMALGKRPRSNVSLCEHPWYGGGGKVVGWGGKGNRVFFIPLQNEGNLTKKGPRGKKK